MRRNVLVPLFFVLLLAVGIMASLGANSAAPARAEQPTIFMKLTGEKGPIPGGVMRSGLEGWIEVIGMNHEIVSPRDAASGLPTGKRQHKPITITKEIDKSTPLIFKALVNNEQIKEVELRFYKPGKGGKEEQYFTIKLENAHISSVRLQNEGGTATETREHVSFVYQKIIWTWTDGGITAEDDWESPAV